MRPLGRERGSAIVEVLGLGGLMVVLLVPAVLTGARIQAAHEAVDEVAQVAALSAARSGDVAGALAQAGAALPDARVGLLQEGNLVTVTVDLEIDLVALDGLVTRTVHGQASAVVSPYRSGRE